MSGSEPPAKRSKDDYWQHEHKNISYQAYKEEANSAPDEATKIESEFKAGNALIEYFQFCSRTGTVGENYTFLQTGLKCMIQLITSSQLTDDRLNKWKEGLELIRERELLANHLLIKIYIKLGEKQKAWSLCRSFDQRDALYEDVNEEVKKLIIGALPTKDSASASFFLHVSSSSSSGEESTRSCVYFSGAETEWRKKWRKESKWLFSTAHPTDEDRDDKLHIRHIHSKIDEKNQQMIGLAGIEKNNLEKEVDELKQSIEDHQFHGCLYQHLPENREQLRRHLAETKFFDPKRSAKLSEVVDWVKNLVAHRYQTKNKVNAPGGSGPKPINLKNKSARFVITGERLYIETIIHLSGGQNTLCIPEHSKAFIKRGAVRGNTSYGPEEVYVVEDTLIRTKHRTETNVRDYNSSIPPNCERLGDTYVFDVPNYVKINDFFKKLTKQEQAKEMKLAEFIIHFTKKQELFTKDKLKEVYEEAVDDDVHKLNRYCFLILEKEQSQFHSATCLNKRDILIGMTVAQARCFLLISKGLLTFEDIFLEKNEASIYSQKDMDHSRNEIRKHCLTIENKYCAYILREKGEDTNLMGRRSVLSREQAHQDLLEIYGGSSDTDGEEYLSDLEESE